MKKTRVLIVDDSLLIRKVFKEILSEDENIEVIGEAGDPLEAREKIKKLNPDVITLDIEMPKMDGLTFLEKIMTLRPTPVIMASSLTQKGAEATIKALELGAVDYVSKTSSQSFDAKELGRELIEKIKSAARAKVKEPSKWGVFGKIKPLTSVSYKSGGVIAIGASTGGVEAVKEVLTVLPPDSPPILITQHMPEAFTKTFAERLDGLSHVKVHEAHDGQKIEQGNAYLAPGTSHLKLASGTAGYICKLDNGEKVSGHRPSVDVMFESVAKIAKPNSIGIILTGMGKDGAAGMLKMKQAGMFNIGQDEASSVVYGMPKAAYLAGAVDKQAPLGRIAKEILGNMGT